MADANLVLEPGHTEGSVAAVCNESHKSFHKNGNGG